MTGCTHHLTAAALATAILSSAATAAEAHGGDAAAQANNPLANMTAFNMQDYDIGKLTDSDDWANQFRVRFAKPFSVSGTNWILRASLPVTMTVMT